MSEHDELADRREAEANYLEAAGDQNAADIEAARDKLAQAQRDEFVPAAMGEHDPGHRAEDDADAEDEENEEEDPAR